jgi:CRISPR-associated protein Cas1
MHFTSITVEAMATFYVDRAGVELRTDGRCLSIYENAQLERSIPLILLDRVVITAPARLTSGVLAWLGRWRIGLVVLSRFDAGRAAFLIGAPMGDGGRRIAQYRAYLDEGWRRRFSRRLLRAKLAAQARALRHLIRERPEERKPLRDALEQIARSAAQLRASDAPLPVLRGVEGAAAVAYFQALAHVIPPALGFQGRNRRPPRDPVNVCLSLAYTLAHYEAVNAIHVAGLDPYIGFYHDLAWNRESLACDLIEPLRPRLDVWVWEMLRSRALRAEHFRQRDARCELGKAGRRIFYEAHEPVAARLRLQMRRMSRLLLRALEAEFPIPREETDEDAVS